MEDVLEVYSRPYDERRPVVCMDEKPIQLLAEAREGYTSQKPGIRYQDNEYVRNGTCSIFLSTEPLANWRYAEAKQQRTRTDRAAFIKWLLDERYPDAEVVVLVCDNLNTHNIASLYEAFEPAEALRLAKRLEIHHTPKHGSWLDMRVTKKRFLVTLFFCLHTPRASFNLVHEKGRFYGRVAHFTRFVQDFGLFYG